MQGLSGSGVHRVVRRQFHRLAGVGGENTADRDAVVRRGGLDGAGAEELRGGVRVGAGQRLGRRIGDVRGAGPREVEAGLPVVLPLGDLPGGVDPEVDVGVRSGQGEPCGLERPGARGTHRGDGGLAPERGGKVRVTRLERRLGLGYQVLVGLYGLRGLGALLGELRALQVLDPLEQAGLLDRLLRVLVEALPFGLTRGLLDRDRLGDGVGGGLRGLAGLVGELGRLVRVLQCLARVLNGPVRGGRGLLGVVGRTVRRVARCAGGRRRRVREALCHAGGIGGDLGVGAGDLRLAPGLRGLGLGDAGRFGRGGRRVRGGGGVACGRRGGGAGTRRLGRGIGGVAGGGRRAARPGRGVASVDGGVLGGGRLGGVLGRGDGGAVCLGGGVAGGGRGLARRGGGVGGATGSLNGGVRSAGRDTRRVGRALGGLGGLAGRPAGLGHVGLGLLGFVGRLLRGFLGLCRRLDGAGGRLFGLLRHRVGLLAFAFDDRDEFLDLRRLLVAGARDVLAGLQEPFDVGGSARHGTVGVLLNLRTCLEGELGDLDAHVLLAGRVLTVGEERLQRGLVARVQGIVPGSVHGLAAGGHDDSGGHAQVFGDGGLEAAREEGGDGGVAAVECRLGVSPGALAAPRERGADGNAVVHRRLRGKRDGEEGLDVGVRSDQRRFRGRANALAAQQPGPDDLGPGSVGQLERVASVALRRRCIGPRRNGVENEAGGGDDSRGGRDGGEHTPPAPIDGVQNSPSESAPDARRTGGGLSPDGELRWPRPCPPARKEVGQGHDRSAS